MKSVQAIPAKLYNRKEIAAQVRRWRLLNKRLVFTNGVFDIIHEGHISSLSEAAAFGDILIVGVNADASVKRLKGPTRPVNHEQARALILASIVVTDAIVIFEEDTPLELIKVVMPDVLVKGGDYTIEQIAGAKDVMDNGGEVKIAAIVPGISTTGIINRMKGE